MAMDFKKLFSNPFGSNNLMDQNVQIIGADHPLAFSDAQNTAQRSKDKSKELQDAFKAVSEGNFPIKKFDVYHKSQSDIEKAGGFMPTTRLQQLTAPGVASSGKDIREASEQERAERNVSFARGMGIKANEYDLRSAGYLPSNFAGFAPTSYRNLDQPDETSTSNVAPFGFHYDQHGNQIRDFASGLSPMPSQGLPISRYQT
jgi:hypothetical protein